MVFRPPYITSRGCLSVATILAALVDMLSSRAIAANVCSLMRYRRTVSTLNSGGKRFTSGHVDSLSDKVIILT